MDQIIAERIKVKALEVAERNIRSGNWTLDTAIFFQQRAFEQPEDFLYLIGGK